MADVRFPAALPRLVRRLQCQFARSWRDSADSRTLDLPAAKRTHLTSRPRAGVDLEVFVNVYVGFRLFLQAHSIMDFSFVGRGDVVFCNPNAIPNAFPLDLVILHFASCSSEFSQLSDVYFYECAECNKLHNFVFVTVIKNS